MEGLLQWAEALQASGLGAVISESALAFPIIEGTHLIGLALAVGLLFLVDLRMLGLLWRDIALTEVLAALRGWILAGFALVFGSGLLLFWAEAPSVVASPAFPFKLLFIALAGANAIWFELRVAREPGFAVEAAALRPRVRRAGAASLALWTLVIICGRLIPYLPDWG
ncbi:hypothetical protein [Derxia gummosa]|uniref:DUF2214 domain-containing protein n=1 Tax=Derxia gummosa DSM 723 TaxID=1121388 RepID=A0A8B6X3V6_9BURK|nr:hypothetical protein [Derxia gummosa]